MSSSFCKDFLKHYILSVDSYIYTYKLLNNKKQASYDLVFLRGINILKLYVKSFSTHIIDKFEQKSIYEKRMNSRAKFAYHSMNEELYRKEFHNADLRVRHARNRIYVICSSECN